MDILGRIRRTVAAALLVAWVPGVADATMLRGVNLSGLEYVSGHQEPRAEAIAYYRARKFNSFRLPISWELIQPSDYGALNSAVVAQVRDVIARAGNATVIIDIHNGGRRYGQVITSFGAYDAFLTTLYRTFAASNVRWELMNEPHQQDDDSVVDLMQNGINTLRGQNYRGAIYVAANDWSGRMAFSATISRNLAILDALVDPLDNLVVSFHNYLDVDGAGRTAAVDPDYMAGLYAITPWLYAHHFKASLTEIGTAGDATSRAALAKVLSFIEKYDDVWVGWDWWGAGGWENPGYVYMLDPYSTKWPSNGLAADPGAATWPNPFGREKAQMGVLAAFLD